MFVLHITARTALNSEPPFALGQRFTQNSFTYASPAFGGADEYKSCCAGQQWLSCLVRFMFTVHCCPRNTIGLYLRCPLGLHNPTYSVHHTHHQTCNCARNMDTESTPSHDQCVTGAAARIFASSADEEICISGVSGQFPSSRNVAEFEENLYNKVRQLECVCEWCGSVNRVLIKLNLQMCRVEL